MLADCVRAHEEQPAVDRIVVRGNATSADYQRLLERRGEWSAPRIAYLEGMLELQPHESLKSRIGHLVEAGRDECDSVALERCPIPLPELRRCLVG